MYRASRPSLGCMATATPAAMAANPEGEPTTALIRVAVVDDEALVREGFTLILEAARDVEVVAAVDGPEALEAIRATRPHVVLLDIRMPGLDGLSILRLVLQEARPPQVAMLTTFDSDEHVAEAIAGGASGFLLKDTDPEHLPQCIRTLAAGGMVLAPSAGRVMVEAARQGRGDPAAAALLDELTEREREVLRRIALGDSNARIGAAMHLGLGTVKDHVSAVLAKLAVPNRVQAALIAERAGLLRDRA